MPNTRNIPDEVKEAFKKSSEHFPTAIQAFQLFDKYSRFDHNKGRRETWPETVDRCVAYLQELSGNKLDIGEYERIHRFMLEMKATPSMRLIAMAGEAARRQNIAIYNCSFLPVDSLDAWVEALIISMSGCGVGFSVEKQFVDKLSTIEKQRNNKSPVKCRVQDTTEGWADALRFGLKQWFRGGDVVFDYSLVRPAGSILKVKGGRASGPKPLRDLLNFARKIILNAQGRKLTPLEAHDIMCMVGQAAVSGGMRRTAMISLFDADDDEMRNCKNGDLKGNEQRWNANNSAVWKGNITDEEIKKQMEEMYLGGRGEPGIFSRTAAKATMPPRRKKSPVFGTNPCFHPDSLVETVKGPVKIKDITSPTFVYSMDKNGKICIRKASASWKTRDTAEIIKITIANNKSIRVTPEHKIMVEGKGWVEAKNIQIKDKVVALVRQRRGAKYSGVKLTSQGKRDFIMEHKLVYEGVNGTIPEGWDIHHRDMDTYNNNIDNLELLNHSVHATLTRFSVPNNHQVRGEKGRFITSKESKHGKKDVVHMPENLKSSFHQYATVEKIESEDNSEVYDISVEETNCLVVDGIVAHNCGEIVLRPYEFCNLTIAVARSTDTFEDLKEKVEVATIIGTIQSMAVNFPGLRSIWRENCEEERLLGTDINGWLDCPLLVKDDGTKLKELRDHTVEINKKYAKILGINQSASVTCVKPSGNSSQLFNCSSGLHARWAPYYIRRVRVSKSSPLFRVLRDAGVPLSPENGQTESNAITYVVSFPVKSPEGAIVKRGRGAVAQCNFWLKVKENWTEHNPSVTVTYGEDEKEDLTKWVIKHKDVIGGMSFLPESNARYDQMPYEEITEEQYNKMISEFPKEIDFSKLYHYELDDMTEAAQLVACLGGSCDI